ncbi:MAG: ADP-heptose--LPS heptosyltransferase [Verrucomicrobia bacterium]|nr:ADP-heptose--LPS heptosyltransferase [Verrucomicrobiota bacterium]
MNRQTAHVELEIPSSSDGTHQLETLETEVARCWWAAASAGDLEKAWRQSDRLTNLGKLRVDLPRFFRPLWDGTPVDNRPVLVRCWRGLGDAIHYARYIPLLAERAKTVCLEAPEQLVPIFAGLQPDQIVPLDSPLKLPAETVEIESTELPYVFRTTLETIPREVPFLTIPFPSSRLVPPDKPNIGLCWAGGSFDPRRALPLESLSVLAKVPGLNWFHLQPEYRTAGGFPFLNSAVKFTDLLALAALIRQLDLIITVDTMVAHLAGALARPVWTLLHFDADWRWFRDRPDSPWYPTMRLFRQRRPGVWDDPIEKVMLELGKPLVGLLSNISWK